MNRTRKIRINGELRGTPRVRVMAADGAMLGEMTLAEALRLALREGLDLVELNPDATPPLCKLLDFEKFKADARKEGVHCRIMRKPSDGDDDDGGGEPAP